MNHTARDSLRPDLPERAGPAHDPRPPGDRPIRTLRLHQVIDAKRLGKTKIYELQAEETFPMRVTITSHSTFPAAVGRGVQHLRRPSIYVSRLPAT